MKKVIVTTLFIAALSCGQLALSGDKEKKETAASSKVASETSKPKRMAKMNPKKVPAGRQYVVLDARGKELKRFKAGETTTLGTDCVQIKCPSTFEDDVTCWKCVESLTTE